MIKTTSIWCSNHQGSPEFEYEKSAFEEVENREKVDRRQINQNNAIGYQGLCIRKRLGVTS
jgi:hypothetical protein